MKKTKLAVIFAVLALSAIPLMAQITGYNTTDYSEELKALIQSDVQTQQQNAELKNVKADLEAIKNLNYVYLSFLGYRNFSKHNQELDYLGKAVLSIKDESVRNAYKDTFNSVKYLTSRGRLSLYEIHLKYNDMNHTLGLDLTGMDFLITYTDNHSVVSTPHPTQCANDLSIHELFVQHNKFIDFMENSADLQGKPEKSIAQAILIELDDLGLAVNNLEEGNFKDSYIKTLKTIKYHFAYNDKVYTLKELAEFATIKAESIYSDGLPGIKVLTANDEKAQKKENSFLQSLIRAGQTDK
ncbi:MAG: hypothetical protein J6S61_04270 [Elusimicrobiaceae bacterium]|nr:hypothetical protein [Elusimicrobiaceae bacterium]